MSKNELISEVGQLKDRNYVQTLVWCKQMVPQFQCLCERRILAETRAIHLILD